MMKYTAVFQLARSPSGRILEAVQVRLQMSETGMVALQKYQRGWFSTRSRHQFMPKPWIVSINLIDIDDLQSLSSSGSPK
jgi:hypothetical protein